LLVLAGLLAYPVANGLLFITLLHVRPTTASFVFNQQPLLVLLLGMVALQEWPRPLQLLGIAAVALGVLLDFGTPEPGESLVWLMILLASAIAFAGYSVVARALARDGRIGILALTTWPLLAGGSVFLAIGLAVEGRPRPSLGLGVLVAWLALVNTTLAYACWNQALRHLRAFEVNVLLALGPIETALIAWPWLHQPPSGARWTGMIAALLGVVLVHAQARAFRPRATPPSRPRPQGSARTP
jgi:drug/metabolite transporter (DMT)-like permease